MWTPEQIAVIILLFEKSFTMQGNDRMMDPRDADREANSVDPDQTVPSVWYGTTLVAQTYLSKKQDLYGKH